MASFRKLVKDDNAGSTLLYALIIALFTSIIGQYVGEYWSSDKELEETVDKKIDNEDLQLVLEPILILISTNTKAIETEKRERKEADNNQNVLYLDEIRMLRKELNLKKDKQP